MFLIYYLLGKTVEATLIIIIMCKLASIHIYARKIFNFCILLTKRSFKNGECEVGDEWY